MKKETTICECNEVVFFLENQEVKLCPRCKKVISCFKSDGYLKDDKYENSDGKNSQTNDRTA